MAEKTPDNFNYGNMTADFRKRYKQMLETRKTKEEAKKGKKKSKGIYGSASKEDLKELKEEGIDAQMIPWIDEKEN